MEVIHRPQNGWAGTMEGADPIGARGPILVRSEQGLEGQRGQRVTACPLCSCALWLFTSSTLNPGDPSTQNLGSHMPPHPDAKPQLPGLQFVSHDSKGLPLQYCSKVAAHISHLNH